MLVGDAQKFARHITVYTNGDADLAKEIHQILSKRLIEDVEVDDRQMVQLAKDANISGIQVHLADGSISCLTFWFISQILKPVLVSSSNFDWRRMQGGTL
jgi:uncharacterized protein YecA (UPF0149 family)